MIHLVVVHTEAVAVETVVVEVTPPVEDAVEDVHAILAHRDINLLMTMRDMKDDMKKDVDLAVAALVLL